MEQLTGLGFLHISNVEEFDEAVMFQAVKDFFAISEDEKHKLKWRHHNKENKNIYRGLAPFVDNDESHKELFDMGYPYELLSEEAKKYPLQEETPFPSGTPEFDNLQHRLNLGIKLAEYIALGLRKERMEKLQS